jgi:hypothetical protein
MRARLVSCLWAIALAGGCGPSEPTVITVTLRIEQEVFRPDYALVSWRQADGRELFTDVRLPARGLLAREGAVLGSVQFQIEASLAGERELQVSGIRSDVRVAGAEARIGWLQGREQQVTLTLGCTENLELADAVAACAPIDPEPVRPPPDAGADSARDALERPPAPPDDPAVPDGRGVDAGTRDVGSSPAVRGDASAARDGASAGRDAGASGDAAADSSGSVDLRPPSADASSADQKLDQKVVLPHPAPAGVDLGRGLLLYLRLDEGAPSATAHDGSGRANQADLVGLDLKTAWLAGPWASPALRFPATPPGWVRVGASAALNEIREGFTISAWVRAPAIATAARRTIVARRSVGPGGFLYSLHLIGNRAGLFIHSSNGANANLVSPVALPSDVWVHVAVVYDVVSARLLVDGEQVAQQGFQLPIGPENSPLSIGSSEDVVPGQASDPLQGDLDEIAVYDHALGPAEIAALASGAQPPLR